MSGYDSDDSHAGDPVLLGVTGDSCGICQTTDVPLYDLSCHASDDFYCRHCLTKKRVAAADDVVRCPACNNDCDFMPLKPIEQFTISRKFSELERLDKIREQPEVMNNHIGFTNREASMFLQLVYGLVEDQILDPTELGGVGTSGQGAHVSDPGSTSMYSFMHNPFSVKFHEEMIAAPKMMTTPLQLEEDLLKLLDTISIDYVKFKHGSTMVVGGVDLDNDEWVLQQASYMYQDVKAVRDNWMEIIKMWVVMLAWRHLECTAPVEGGAAERFRTPVTLP